MKHSMMSQCDLSSLEHPLPRTPAAEAHSSQAQVQQTPRKNTTWIIKTNSAELKELKSYIVCSLTTMKANCKSMTETQQENLQTRLTEKYTSK